MRWQKKKSYSDGSPPLRCALCELLQQFSSLYCPIFPLYDWILLRSTFLPNLLNISTSTWLEFKRPQNHLSIWFSSCSVHYYIKTLKYVIYQSWLCTFVPYVVYSVLHTPCRFALVLRDQNKITGVVVMVVAQAGEIAQLTEQTGQADTQWVGKE